MPSSAVAALGALAPNADLVFLFFAFFSRFECALKRPGFLRETNGRAEPDWDNYANSLRDRFADVDDQAFQDAVAFLVKAPPQRQVVDNNNTLGWEDTPQGQGEHREGYVLRLLRIVRNNLFHGGKYPIPMGSLEDTARNEALLNEPTRARAREALVFGPLCPSCHAPSSNLIACISRFGLQVSSDVEQKHRLECAAA